MLLFSERAQIALEKSNEPLKAKLDLALKKLDRGEQFSQGKHRLMHSNIDVWVIRVDFNTRLLYSKKDGQVVILDILDRSEYVS
jgi:hypothetical protein